MAAAGIPVISAAYSSVYDSTFSAYDSKPLVEWAMNSLLCKSWAMIAPHRVRKRDIAANSQTHPGVRPLR